MESKKGGASIDDLFGHKETNKPSSGSGYFNSMFACSPNSGMGKDVMLSKQRTETHAGNGYTHAGNGYTHAGNGYTHAGNGYTHAGNGYTHAGNGYAYSSDGKSQGSPTKKPTAYMKDGKSYSLNESAESPYFGSSVHYGGRDFYGGSPPKYTVETSKNYKDENQDDSVATRGDWWQGSLYY